MKFFAVTLCALLSAPVARATKVDGDRTITKVVKLLQDMLKKSQEDGDKDRFNYAEFKCYCVDNELETRESIKEWKKEIQMIENEIDKIQAENGELSSACAQLKEDIADNEAARATAEELREKENKDFIAEESDMTTGIDAMDQAIDTLSAIGADQTASSGADHAQFMGKGGEGLIKLKASVKKALASASVLMNAKEKRTVNAFLQAPFTGTYTSQSGEIVGILKNMRDTFKENLASIRAAEKAAVEAFEKFMKIKKEEHATMTALYEEKQAKLGENDEELADQRLNLQDAQDSLAADEEFLAKLLPMCEKKAKEFEQRNMLRANEQAAISKAIAILNSDAAFEAFGKVDATSTGATGPAAMFLQIQQHDQVLNTRRKVMKILQGAALKQKSLKIARIMVLLEADNPFDTVLEEIKKMIAIIDEEQKTDDEQLAWCGSEREEYHGNVETAKSDIENLEGQITKLDDSIHNEETGFIAMIKENEDMLKTNHDSQVEQTTSRQAVNKAYQISIKNTVAAEGLLKKAIKVLKEYYSQFDKKELLQEDPAPTTWDDVESGVQKDAGADVIGMLEFIAEETKKEENEAHSDEEKAQHDFEDSMEELKSEQAKLIETIADLHVQLADAEKSLGEAKAELEKTQTELKRLEDYLEKIKPGCDYIETNHDARTEGRKKEKEALENATELIKGTPAYKAAVAAAAQEALGDCKDICNEAGRKHAKCEACLAGVSVPGYCAGHAGTEGC